MERKIERASVVLLNEMNKVKLATSVSCGGVVGRTLVVWIYFEESIITFLLRICSVLIVHRSDSRLRIGTGMKKCFPFIWTSLVCSVLSCFCLCNLSSYFLIVFSKRGFQRRSIRWICICFRNGLRGGWKKRSPKRRKELVAVQAEAISLRHLALTSHGKRKSFSFRSEESVVGGRANTPAIFKGVSWKFPFNFSPCRANWLWKLWAWSSATRVSNGNGILRKAQRRRREKSEVKKRKEKGSRTPAEGSARQAK